MVLERELALLAEGFAAVCAGRGGQLVFVCGEAGVGKTTLVGSFQNELPEGSGREVAGARLPYEAALALAESGDLEVAGQAVDEL